MAQKVSTLLEVRFDFRMRQTAKQLLDEACSFVTFPKGTAVLMQGESAINLYFMIKGIVRGYYIDEKGNDITKCFSCENEFFSTECFRTNRPSSFHVECLEACECIQIPYKALQKAMEEDILILKALNQYALQAMSELEDRARDFIIISAEERYQLFLKQFPNVEQRINQKYIASYIGIRESSLSRIKKSKN